MTVPTSGPSRSLLIGAMAVCSLVWGTTWAVIQIGLEGVPPFLGVSLRFGISGLILLGLALATGVKLGRAPHEKMLWWVNALLSFCVSYGVVYWVEQHLPSGLTAILFATYPLLVAIFGHFLIPTEHVGARETMFILLSLVGVAVIYSEDLTALGSPQARTAALVMGLAPLTSALGSVLVKKYGAQVHPMSITAVPMLIACGVMGGVAALFERQADVQWTGRAIGALLYLAIAGSALTFGLYYWLLKHMKVRRASLIAYIVPVVAVIVGLLRDEPMTTRVMIGAALVILGVILTTSQRG